MNDVDKVEAFGVPRVRIAWDMIELLLSLPCDACGAASGQRCTPECENSVPETTARAPSPATQDGEG